MKISAYLVTKNEEKRLPATLKAISEVADEIIVVDCGSTDKTEEIAKQFGAKFIFHEWISFAHQKNYAQNQCQNDWLLSVDADEVLSNALIKEILKLKKTNTKHKVYNVKIVDMYKGFKKPKRWAKKYNIIRLYHKDYATMKADLLTEDRISLTQKVKIGQLNGPIHHYSFLNISHQVAKFNQYTDEVISTAQKKKKHYTVFRLITEFPRQFFIYYFKKRQFVNGFWGFVVSMNSAYARFLKIAKYIERERIEKCPK